MGYECNSGSESRSNAVCFIDSILMSDIVCLEGHGARPSHRGDGWSEGGVMYTLNSTEVHCVAYEVRKTQRGETYG